MFIRYGYGGGGFPLWFSIIGSIIWLVISLSRPGRHVGMRWYAGGGGYGPRFHTPALQELDLAYARGQLTREEYFRRRADLTGWEPPGGPPGSVGGPGPGPQQGQGDDPGASSSS
jgi:hypothetical protein